MTPVVLVLALLAPAFGFPFATLELTPGIQTEQGTLGTNILPQTQSGIQEKTGAPVPTGCSSGYSVPVNQGNVAQPVTRVQDTPVNVEQTVVPHTEPLFLPPQPVTVSQGEQILRPVIVPAEAITSGRVIVMAVEPIQQRAFPDVIIVPQQQTIITETPIQQIEPAEKQTPYQETYSQVPIGNVQQIQPILGEAPQRHGQVQYESTQGQVYPGQGVQPETQIQQVQGQFLQQVEKQGLTGVENTPVQTVGQVQTGEPVQRAHQEQNVQQTAEQQQQQVYENVQQVEPVSQQQVYSSQVVPCNVQNPEECAQQQSQTHPQLRVNVQETVQHVQQSGVEAQQQTYNVQPEQVQQSGVQAQQQTYSVQPGQVQQSGVEGQQQTYNVQPEEVQKSIGEVQQQTYSAQTEQVQQVGVQPQQQTYSVQPEQVQQVGVQPHQQTYSVQPEQVGQQTQSVEQQQQTEVQSPATRTGNQQAQNEQQQITGQVYNFGDKIPRPVETVVHQQHLVQPAVVDNQ